MNILVTPRSGRGMSSKLLPPPFSGLDLSTTCAWGTRPGEARVRYIQGADVPPVPIMAVVHLGWENHAWTGVCLDDQEDVSESSGRVRSLRVVDTRQYLEWDTVFAAFNQRENRIVDGLLERRYWHVLPRDFVTGRRTFTSRPYSGRQVLEMVFGFTRGSRSPHYTVETRWRLATHRILTQEPVLDLDWLRGANLQQIAQEVADRLGLVVGVIPEDPWTLRFERKGYGVLPVFPETGNHFPPFSNERRFGWSYSGTPTRVRVVGERSVYQVMDIELTPDWLPAWERFLDLVLLEDDLFHRATDHLGRALNTLPNDTDQAQGRFLASALAREITVGQYALLRHRRPRPRDVAGEEWRDTGMWQGRRRADMPAALYVTRILFRAFRPKDLRFPISGAGFVPVESMEVLPRLLVPVSHDPITGRMQVDLDSPTDGNGYAIAQGYQIGADGLLTVQPEFFRLETWRSLQELWQAVPFTVDKSGERYPTVLFNDPMILSENLVDMVDGLPVIRADAVLRAPKVRACLVFAAEVFQHVEGVGPRDRVELVANLGPEYVASASGGTRLVELPYADGQTARTKARRIARAILDQPAFTVRGGYRNPGMNGQRLHGLLDRVSCVVSAQGAYEEIDFTTERLPASYESERRFDRIRREQLLLPGQSELKAEARALRLLSSSVRSAPDLRNSMQALLRGTVEPPMLLRGVQNPAEPMEVGTPLWGWHSTPEEPERPEAQPLGVHNSFFGVTTRQNEPAGGLLAVRRTGLVHARVRGPVSPNEVVGRPQPLRIDESTWAVPPYLVGRGDPVVGVAQSAVADGETRLIPVLISGAQKGHVKAMRKYAIHPTTRQVGDLLESFGPAFSVIAEEPPGNSGLPLPLSDYMLYFIRAPSPGDLDNAMPRVTFRFLKGSEDADFHFWPVTYVEPGRDNGTHVATSNIPQYNVWAAWGENAARTWQRLKEEVGGEAEKIARFYAAWAVDGYANPNLSANNLPDAPSVVTPQRTQRVHLRTDQILVEFI